MTGRKEEMFIGSIKPFRLLSSQKLVMDQPICKPHLQTSLRGVRDEAIWRCDVKATSIARSTRRRLYAMTFERWLDKRDIMIRYAYSQLLGGYQNL